jgi:hypothetical protein
MSESVRTSLLADPQERIDGAFFELVNEADLGASGIYKKLTVQPERADPLLAEFERTGANPNLRATHLDVAELEQEHAGLEAAKSKIWATPDVSDDIRRQYRYKTNELLGNLRMARASHDGDMRRFRAYNVFVYGEPDPETFAAAADWFRTDAGKHLQSEHASVREAAWNVLAKVEDYGSSRDHLIPDPETFAAVRADHYRKGGFYTLLLAGVNLPDKGPITREMADPMLEQVRTNIGADNFAITDAKAGTWGVGYHPPQLQRPVKMNMPLQRFVGLGPGHEWGSHVLEHVNGLRSKLGLAAIGLDRYERNEGRALIREEITYETFDEFAKQLRWQDVMRRGFAIGLGHGANSKTEDGKFQIDREPKSFGDVYATINAIDQLWERVKNPTDPDAADKKANTRTKALLKRVLKGTDGTGGAYLKDKVYPEGHVDVWRTAKEYGPKAIENGDYAKQDITNRRHVEFLQKYGVTPHILVARNRP